MIIYLATKSTFKSRQKQNTVSYIENCQNKQVNRGVLKVSELWNKALNYLKTCFNSRTNLLKSLKI